MISFEHQADKAFFYALLRDGAAGGLAHYEVLFDLRSPAKKRQEFERDRHRLYQLLVTRDGETCRLRLSEGCEGSRNLQVDHVIPLATNELNKHLRGARGAGGKKVPTQSFGSNDPANLVLACGACNGHKKHRFVKDHGVLSAEDIRRLGGV